MGLIWVSVGITDNRVGAFAYSSSVDYSTAIVMIISSTDPKLRKHRAMVKPQPNGEIFGPTSSIRSVLLHYTCPMSWIYQICLAFGMSPCDPGSTQITDFQSYFEKLIFVSIRH